jgi:hypothetical protein
MPRLPRQNYHDIERIIEFDFVRATEAAARSNGSAVAKRNSPTPPRVMRSAECSTS